MGIIGGLFPVSALDFKQPVVNATVFYEVVVVSSLNDLAISKDYNLVGISYCGKAGGRRSV